MPNLKNPRHEAFSLEYHQNGFNAKQAYKSVYQTKNDRTAEVNGERLLSNAEVASRLKGLQDEAEIAYGIDMIDIVTSIREVRDKSKNALDYNATLKANDMLIKIVGGYAPTKSENTNKDTVINITTNLNEE